MKKICLLLSLILFVTCFTACEKEEPPEQVNVEPKVEQMHAICEMATMKCYYHNVAKYFEKDAEGFGWWKKDRKFWVEYDGVVILGVEVNEIEMKI